jgi:hypothetical protein
MKPGFISSVVTIVRGAEDGLGTLCRAAAWRDVSGGAAVDQPDGCGDEQR